MSIGEIVRTPGETEVWVRMRLQVFVGAFTAFWFGGLLWGAAMMLRVGLLDVRR